LAIDLADVRKTKAYEARVLLLQFGFKVHTETGDVQISNWRLRRCGAHGGAAVPPPPSQGRHRGMITKRTVEPLAVVKDLQHFNIAPAPAACGKR